jgi:hypothetical protein
MVEGIEFYFGENLTSAQRELAEQSIASSVERTLEAAKPTLQQSAEDDELLDTITAPITKLIREDPRAAAALDRLGKRQIEPDDNLRIDDLPRQARDHIVLVSPTDEGVDLRLPPYDFAWSWHDPGGAPPFNKIGDREGRLGVDARAGNLTGGADRRVNAHIGVGCIVRLDRPTVVGLFAVRNSRHSFVQASRGISASATSEGGLETTFMRGGQVKMAGTLPLWRKRVSGFEDARDRRDFSGGVFPDGMGGRLDPGEYAYNVGIWAFADFSSGVGSAAVQALTQSNILEMRIHRS